MIEVYQWNERTFSSNGYPLECIELTLRESINGVWSVEGSVPEESKVLINDQSVIKAPTPNGMQLFRINHIEKADYGCTFVAYPLAMDLANIIVRDRRPTNATGQQALNALLQGTDFTGESDISDTSTAYWEMHNIIECINGDIDQSIVNRWGGEIAFDNYKVIINSRIGADNGMRIEMGFNLSEISETIDSSGLITRIIPKAYNGRYMTNKGYVNSEYIWNYADIHESVIEFNDVKLAEDAQDGDYEDDSILICQTQEELNTALSERAETYFNETECDRPVINYQCSIIDLAQTKKYKDFAHLVSLNLGDTVRVHHKGLNIDHTARVISIEYDCLTQMYTNLEIGQFSPTYFEKQSDLSRTLEKVVDTNTGSVMAETIKGVINLMDTQMVAQKSNAKRTEVRAILFEDTDEDSETFGALCIGTQGIQIAQKRINNEWQWGTAINFEAINADYIITGVLADRSGNFFLNMNTGELVMGDGLFKGNITTNKDAKVGRWLYLDYDGNIDTSTFANYSRITLGHDKNTDPMPFVGFAKNNNGTESIVLATSSGQNGPLMSITKGQSSTALIQSSNGGTGIGVIDNQVQINNADAVFINTGDLVINGKTGLTGTFSNVTGFKVQNGLVYSVTGQRGA